MSHYLSKTYIAEKWNHAGFQKYFRNMGWMFGGRMFTLILSFFVSVYMARNLGVENFGTLNFVISFVSIAGPCLFVIESLLLQKLINEPENTNKILGSAFIIKIISAFLLIISSTTASFFFANTTQTTFLVFIFSTFSIFQSIHLIDYYFQAHANIKKVIPLNILVGVLSSIIKIIIISLNTEIIYLLISYVFDYFITAIIYIYLYKKYVGKISNWEIDINLVKSFITNSWPFTISAIATVIYMKVDQIFLKLFLGSNAVGLYVVAVRFSEVWLMLPSIICISLLPAIVNAKKTNDDLFLTRSKKLYSLLFYSSITICIFIMITASFIIKILYGDNYVQSISILRIYIWSIIGLFISTALQQFLLAQNRFKTILFLNVLGMLFSLILNYIFIPIWGIKGAAIANIFAYTLPTVIILGTKSMKDQRKALIFAILKPLK